MNVLNVVFTQISQVQAFVDMVTQYPKIVLTLDRFTVGDYDGIQVVNVLDWLLEEQ